MTRQINRAAAATADVMRILPFAGPPAHMSPGEIPAGPATMQPLTGPHFERQVLHLHRLGPRVFAEMLDDIARHTGQSSFIADRLQAYARLDPEAVRFVGGDKFPPMPLGVVR